jgi:hypothetical protein
VDLPLLPVAAARGPHQEGLEGAVFLTLSTYTVTISMSSALGPEISAIPLNSSSPTRLVVTWLCFLAVDG